MFTGLVEAKGTLRARSPRGQAARLAVSTSMGPLVLGESISTDGVCLTVAAVTTDGFEADASHETLDKTTLGALPLGVELNLERALAVGDRLGGHLVSGHVDGVGTVSERVTFGDSLRVAFSLPKALARFVAQKGSVTVNGVSLTVNHVAAASFDVVLIPHTQKVTGLAALAVGASVNLEVDVLARYVARLLDTRDSETTGTTDTAWLDRLGRAGML